MFSRFFCDAMNMCRSILADVVYTSAVLLGVFDDSGSCDMGRVLGIDIDIFHLVDHGDEGEVPSLGRVLIDADFHRAEHIDLFRQSHKGCLKLLCHLEAFFRRAFEFECYDMFYHCFAVI